VNKELEVKSKKELESGRDLSDKEYLDYILRKSNKQKKISDLILKFFPDRDLSPFQVSLLKPKLTKDTPIKRIKGKIWNGSGLANFIEFWMEKLNNATIPNVNVL
jgi:hypothetical protein